MPFHLHPGDTGECGATVVVIVLAARPGLTDSPKSPTRPDDIDLPVWPENDASFDYRAPSPSGVRS